MIINAMERIRGFAWPVWFALVAIISIVIVPSASAAALHGTVYNADLQKVDNAIIEINSVPMQRILSENGTYL